MTATAMVFSVANRLKAVSYTHLDVYKRQHWELWELTPEYADLEQIFVRLTLGGQASA